MTARGRHTFEDALDEREFQLLLEGASDLVPAQQMEARFVILVGGRLGLRPGEVTHLDESWVSWQRDMIDIPRHDRCSCGYCWSQAKQEAEHNEDVTPEMAMEKRWKPKTSKAARAVPFDFSPRVSLIVERFLDRHGEYPHSRSTVNRRVHAAAEKADGVDPETTYPHCLRATAATYHASRGLDALQLQAMMGWADLSTAQKYVRLTGEHTARALRQIHAQ